MARHVKHLHIRRYDAVGIDRDMRQRVDLFIGRGPLSNQLEVAARRFLKRRRTQVATAVMDSNLGPARPSIGRTRAQADPLDPLKVIVSADMVAAVCILMHVAHEVYTAADQHIFPCAGIGNDGLERGRRALGRCTGGGAPTPEYEQEARSDDDKAP